MRVAFITGITGQDGSYLAELLLEKGYVVHGMIRRSSNINTQRIDHIFSSVNLHYGDMSDGTSLVNILTLIRKQMDKNSVTSPLEIYNLAAQSHVAVSFEMPEYTGQVDAMGTLRILEAIRTTEMINRVRFYQASTSELFGLVQETPQKETTPFYPRSPYGVAKLYGFWLVKNYREAYNLFACNGILFNHSSPRRGHNFIEKKVVMGLKKILSEPSEILTVGNLNAKRDIGHARDYVEGMWRMLQHSQPDDYILATGETHSVREIIETAFQLKGIYIEWRGEGVNEVGVDVRTGRTVVNVSARYYRPTEVDLLLGDPSKARNILGWTPRIYFHQLIQDMIDNEFM